MYEDRTQNSDPEIHEDYLIHNTGTPITLPQSIIAMCRLQHSYRYKHN